MLGLPGGEASLASDAWIEAFLRSGNAGSVQQSDDLTMAIVAAAYISKCPPPPGTSTEGGWVAFAASLSNNLDSTDLKELVLPSPLFLVAQLGGCLSRGGIVWRPFITMEAKQARVLIQKPDLPAAASAFVRAGHLVTPRLDLPLRQLRLGQKVPEAVSQAAGVWKLTQREDPAGTVIEKFMGTEDGFFYLQSRNGFFVQVKLPSAESSDVCSHSSRCGQFQAIKRHGQISVVTDSIIDFQPCLGGLPVRQRLNLEMQGDNQVLQVAGLPPLRHLELWTRVSDPSDQVVTLELIDRKRAGLWIFVGQRFARVVGLYKKGLVGGSSCKSLKQLQRFYEASALEAELREHYEALQGEVEVPGEMRVLQDAWNARSGKLLFSASDKLIGGKTSLRKVDGKVDRVLIRLPDGSEEKWKVHEWDFDPFCTQQQEPDADDQMSAKKDAKKRESSASSEGSSRHRKKGRSKSEEVPAAKTEDIRPPPPQRPVAPPRVTKVLPPPDPALAAVEEAKASKFASAFAAAAAAFAAATAAPSSSSQDVARAKLPLGFGQKKEDSSAPSSAELQEKIKQEELPENQPPKLPAVSAQQETSSSKPQTVNSSSPQPDQQTNLPQAPHDKTQKPPQPALQSQQEAPQQHANLAAVQVPNLPTQPQVQEQQQKSQDALQQLKLLQSQAVPPPPSAQMQLAQPAAPATAKGGSPAPPPPAKAFPSVAPKATVLPPWKTPPPIPPPPTSKTMPSAQ